jgi:hypothetical protein
MDAKSNKTQTARRIAPVASPVKIEDRQQVSSRK